MDEAEVTLRDDGVINGTYSDARGTRAAVLANISCEALAPSGAIDGSIQTASQFGLLQRFRFHSIRPVSVRTVLFFTLRHVEAVFEHVTLTNLVSGISQRRC
jgi:hypothetical protein